MRYLKRLLGAGLLAAVLPLSGLAQTAPDPQSLAQIRAEIGELAQEIAGLRGELVAPDPQLTGIVNPAPLRQRVDETGLEVQRLQAAIEALALRVEQVVADGTNRIGDLEFRLLELSDGDLASYKEPAALGEGPGAADTSALAALRPKLRGGATVSQVQPTSNTGGETVPLTLPPTTEAPGLPPVAPLETAQTVQTDQQAFDAALAKFKAGDFTAAEQAFGTFLTAHPGSALVGDAAFWRGSALAGLGDWNQAARAYLNSFSGAPQGPKAPEALLRLGQSLGRLGQTNEACLTLAEVPLRYPNVSTDLAQQAQAERRALSCS